MFQLKILALPMDERLRKGLMYDVLRIDRSRTEKSVKEDTEKPIHRFEHIGDTWYLQFENQKTETADEYGFSYVMAQLEKKHVVISVLTVEGRSATSASEIGEQYDKSLTIQSPTNADEYEDETFKDLARQLREIDFAVLDRRNAGDELEAKIHEAEKCEFLQMVKKTYGLSERDLVRTKPPKRRRRLTGGDAAIKALSV